MSKQTFRLPTWRRKPTADETAPDIADSELVPAESAARPTRHKHGKRTYVIGGALLALAIAAAIIIPGALRHIRKSIFTKFCSCVTSLVSLVTSDPAENLSILANEKH